MQGNTMQHNICVPELQPSLGLNTFKQTAGWNYIAITIRENKKLKLKFFKITQQSV